MKVSMLLIVAAFVKSGPGMAARRMQAACRAKAVLMMRTEKALSARVSIWSAMWGACQEKRGRRETHLSATNVNVNRSSNHLSVCGAVASGGVFPTVEASERSVVFEPSIFLKLTRWRMYLIRIATMQTPPTAQQQSTVLVFALAVLRYGMGFVIGWETYLGRR
jgi:hypothetical protein